MVKDRKRSLDLQRRSFLRAGIVGGLGMMVGPLRALAGAKPKVLSGATNSSAGQPSSPPWTKDLILYELSWKGFTSPSGPGTGTYESLRAKLPYLEELGITGIWMGAPWLSDSHFQYNIWTHYAVLEPDKLDPTLGTEEQFERMVKEAHQSGIRVFLDVKACGPMASSPLLKKHPEWFHGVSWGMPDFDWYGGHTDLDEWWVKIWCDYITKYKVDGFRLDVNIFRPDLWERVRQHAAAIGHPIAIFEEGNAPIPGVTDFIQKEYELPIEVLLEDMPGFYDRKYGTDGPYRVIIQYDDDGRRVEGTTDGQGTLRVRLDGLKEDKVSRRKGYPHVGDGIDTPPDGVPDVQLTVENVESRPIENITVLSEMGYLDGKWQLVPYHFIHSNPIRPLNYEGKPPVLKLYIATLQNGWPTIELSCHDRGSEGFPLDENPYVARGSRSLFGYSVLLAPAIPLFFAGEEFNANFRPLPWQSPYLYGGKDFGKGRWLYGSWLNWDELNDPEHRAMFEDVKRMIAIRKREADVLTVLPERERPKLMAVPFQSDLKVPKPYIRWNERKAILVAANRDTTQDASLKLQIPLQEIGLAGRRSYRVTDLWPGGETRTCAEKELAAFVCLVRRDKSQGVGLRVLKIEPSL